MMTSLNETKFSMSLIKEGLEPRKKFVKKNICDSFYREVSLSKLIGSEKLNVYNMSFPEFVEAEISDLNIRNMRCDFVIAKNGKIAVIEINGEQHMDPVQRFCDLAKKKLLEQAGIKMYTIEDNVDSSIVKYILNDMQ